MFGLEICHSLEHFAQLWFLFCYIDLRLFSCLHYLPLGSPGAPGVKFSTPKSPGIKFMDGGGFPSRHLYFIYITLWTFNMP